MFPSRQVECPFTDLPFIIQKHIYKMLDLSSATHLGSCSRVCRVVMERQDFWEDLLRERFIESYDRLYRILPRPVNFYKIYIMEISIKKSREKAKRAADISMQIVAFQNKFLRVVSCITPWTKSAFADYEERLRRVPENIRLNVEYRLENFIIFPSQYDPITNAYIFNVESVPNEDGPVRRVQSAEL